VASPDAFASLAARPTHPPVDEERVRAVLAGSESSALDYKRELHPDDKRHLVRAARHIAAISARGGDIIVGADNGGKPTGLVTERDQELFDEARLRDKLKACGRRRDRSDSGCHTAAPFDRRRRWLHGGYVVVRAVRRYRAG
jgi:hypothetical protein